MKMKGGFKFINVVTEVNGYNEAVKESWQRSIRGEVSHKIWNKLTRLKTVIRQLHEPFMNIKGQIEHKRTQLQALQQQLSLDRMNPQLIVQEKICYEELINLNDME